MIQTEARPLMSPHISCVVPTGADTNSLDSRTAPSSLEFHSRWQDLIDHKLLEWLRDSSQLDDDDIEQPGGMILRLSIDLAEQLRDKGLPAPDRIVPDPNGGIVFERRRNELLELIHIWEDGTTEYQQFRGANLVVRCPL